MKKDLIIDVGMHTGKDTQFYLDKGFRVVAVEAIPDLVKQARVKFKDYIKRGLLKIENIAINDYEGVATFYINKQYSDWGTLDEEFLQRNISRGTETKRIEVKCTKFENVLTKYGIPYYLKIDIEGADLLCVKALHHFESSPKYISIESGLFNFDQTFDELSHLYVLGYKNFKIVNQILNHTYRCPNPPLEGKYVETRFDGHMSGPFGEETPGKWLNVEATFLQYRKILREQSLFSPEGKYYGTLLHKFYKKLGKLTGREPIGWYDIHAKLG